MIKRQVMPKKALGARICKRWMQYDYQTQSMNDMDMISRRFKSIMDYRGSARLI